MHQSEGEPSPAKILQGSPDMINLIVDEQEAVMCPVERIYLYRLVLCIVALEVKLQLLTDMLRIYRGRHSSRPLVEHRQHSVVHIVVYQYNPSRRLSYQVGNKPVGIEYLSVIKDTLHGWKRCAHKEINLLFCSCHALLNSHHSAIDGITTHQVLLDDTVRPLTEFYTSFGIYPKAYRYNSIQIVEFNLSGDHTCSLFAN